MKIAMVAGESSGDYLAAGLVRALRRARPDIDVEGIGGPMMAGEGVAIHYPMDAISIMGTDGLVGGIRQILRIRRDFFRRLIKRPPDVFIGVDVPDFNLGLERGLKRAGIRTIHYVSPTVWAWRAYRVRKIRRAVDLMLTLFPFEADYYRARNVPVAFVGHPLADEIPPAVDRPGAREALGVRAGCVVALLPGSRLGELERHSALFVDVAAALQARAGGELEFLAPFASRATLEFFRGVAAARAPELAIRFLEGQARQVLAASDLALLASGTAALEAALHQVPMVVTYKVSWITSVMVRAFAQVEHFSMPNHLLPAPIVPELMQSRATVEAVGREMRKYLEDAELRRRTAERLACIPEMLRGNANERAAEQVLRLAGGAAGGHGA